MHASSLSPHIRCYTTTAILNSLYSPHSHPSGRGVLRVSCNILAELCGTNLAADGMRLNPDPASRWR